MSDPGGESPVDGEVRVAQQWVSKLPGSTDRLADLGRSWIKKARHSADPGFYLHAGACADLVLELEPDSILARELKAQVLLNGHRFTEADKFAREVLDRQPESLLALAVQVDALYELGDVDGAIAATDRLAQIKPSLASYSRVSFFQWLRGDMGNALRSAKLAIEAGSDPQNPEPQAFAMVQTATFFFQKGDYEGADEGYKKALEVFTDYAPARIGRGRVAMARGDYAAAVDQLKRAYASVPLAETAWRLGDALAAAGDAAGAERVYADVVRLGAAQDKRTLSLFYSTKNRDAAEALRLAQEEMKVRPGLYTQDALAWALYRNGKLGEAKAASDRAMRLKTPDATLLFHAGAIRISLGDRQAGAELIDLALKTSPHFDPAGAEEARKLLAENPVETANAPIR